jgi:hypothetical protein
LAEHHNIVREVAAEYKASRKKRVQKAPKPGPEEPDSFQPSLFD